MARPVPVSAPRIASLTIRRMVSACLAAILAVPPTVACAGQAKSSGQPGGESPQAVVERINRAGETEDFGEFVNCIEPKGRSQLTGGMLAVVTMTIAFMDMGGEMMGGMAEGMAEGMSGEELSAEQKAEIEKGKQEAANESKEIKERFAAVLEKHGMPDLLDPNLNLPQDTERDELFANVDHGAFLTDLMGVMEALGDGEEATEEASMPLPFNNALEVKNYKIEGDHATADASGETVDFVRIDGRWYLALPEEAQQAVPDTED